MLPPSTAYSPTPHSRNHPYPRSEGNSSSIILVPTLPSTSLRHSFFLTRLSALPPSGSSVPPPSPRNLPTTQPLSSPFHLSRNPDKRRIYGIKRNKAEVIAFAFLKNVHTYTCIDTSVHYRRLSRSFVSKDLIILG